MTTLIALGLQDTYTPSAMNLSRFAEIQKRSQKLLAHLAKRPRVPKWKANRLLGSLPDESDIKSKLEISCQTLTREFERLHGDVSQFIRLVLPGRKFSAAQFPEYVKFQFPQEMPDFGWENWFKALAVLDIAMTARLIASPCSEIEFELSDWLISRLYVRLSKVPESQNECRLTLVSIGLRSPYQGRGAGQLIFSSFRQLALRHNIPLEAECVQPRLSMHLHRQGWLRRESCDTVSNWVDPRTVPIESSTARELISLWGKSPSKI